MANVRAVFSRDGKHSQSDHKHWKTSENIFYNWKFLYSLCYDGAQVAMSFVQP